MSEKERQRLSILQQHLGGLLTAEEAAAELEMSERQFYRIKARYIAEGDAGLLHRARGRLSNFGFPPRIKQEVLDLYRRKYADYGPTLFAERMERNRFRSCLQDARHSDYLCQQCTGQRARRTREQEVRWQYAAKHETRQQQREIGKADTFDHPWYKKPVGRLKQGRARKRRR